MIDLDLLKELFTDTYKQSVDDNMKDYMNLYSKISRLCVYLTAKGILNQEELNDILKSHDLEDFEKEIEGIKNEKNGIREEVSQ